MLSEAKNLYPSIQIGLAGNLLAFTFLQAKLFQSKESRETPLAGLFESAVTETLFGTNPLGHDVLSLPLQERPALGLQQLILSSVDDHALGVGDAEHQGVAMPVAGCGVSRTTLCNQASHFFLTVHAEVPVEELRVATASVGRQCDA